MPAVSLATPTPDWRVGVDTGGTFTDLLLVDPQGAIRGSCKVLSTPDDPGRAVREGIDQLLATAATRGHISEDLIREIRERGLVVHGSTVATNAILETKTDRAALITTAGFEDLLILARQDRPELYALAPQRPAPLIPRSRVVGVHERLAYDGRVLTALTPHEIDRVVQAVQTLDVAAVAICLLHSYANDKHERLLAEAIRSRFPKSRLHLTVSSELLPELREYERASTCAVNAVVGPTMSRYLGELDRTLGEGRLRIMASGGGTLPTRVVMDRPVETVMSGPAGGVIGAWAMAKAADQQQIIGFDMGGTSTDVALCDNGPMRTTETAINGLPIRLPMIDIHTVGAGGGSIARIDDGGALRVGPESAGANPGPACYGKQGDRPMLATVTDAHAVLGHLRDGRQLGDALSVDREAATHAVDQLAVKLGLTIQATAEGILRVADAAMARAIQRISVQRGYDPRAYTLVAFGGAGGLHACRLADLLGMMRVLIPVYGGLLSAFGMLAAPPRYAYSQAVLLTFVHHDSGYEDPLQHAPVREAINQLLRRGEQALTDDGVAAFNQIIRPSLDLRFAGQSYEINVPTDSSASVIERFIAEHRRLYGYAPEGKPIELVTVRIEAIGPAPVLTPIQALRDTAYGKQEADQMEVFVHGRMQTWQRSHRDTLTPGTELSVGLAIVEEYAATTVIPHGWALRVLDDGQLLLEKQGETHA